MGPGDRAPDTSDLDADTPCQDRHLEEDREAIIEEMSGVTQGLASASSGLIELARNSSRGT
eukprot:5017847-Alexandrium_andersonii.AAC.1